MSKTIDQKVVEMRFDNKHFENNVQESMSTLDKLKQKLNFTGASKGLENLNTSANKVNMSGLSGALDTVHSKFSALEVMGVTALVNITNSAVNAGKRIVESLTIAPIKDGWSEYEMTLNAVQTTMAGTGKTAKEVEVQLKRLDEYADKTVYSTADMLNNLPKFTNAGVELEDATTAMIGIANATALAGGDANKASIAFYNLGQAIGTGYLTRMDYNSINNAGIATMEWKNQMVEAAIAAGTLKKVGEDSYKAGNKTLTLQQLFIDGLQEQWATTEVLMKVFQDYGDETTEIGKKAYSSAQDIRTFTMMMESLKATAGTGWKDTWQIIFGDLEQAKEFWTGLTNFISGIITGFANARNKLLSGALSFNPITKIMDAINSSSIGRTAKKIDGITKSLGYYQDMVNKIWRGDYKNQPVRSGLLEAEGHNYKVLQSLVNLGYKHKITKEEVAAAEKKYGKVVTETTEVVSELTDAQLKEIGLTEEEIKIYRQLEEQSKKTGKSIDEIIKSMEQKDGRTLLIESFANAGKGLVSIFKAIGTAWRDAFPAMTSLQLYNIIAGLNKFSEHLVMSEKTSKKLTRTLKGVFAIIDMITMVIGGGFKIAFTILKTVLSAFNLDILDFTAMIGDAIVAVRDWIEDNNILIIGIQKIADVIVKVIKGIQKWLATNKTINKALDSFKNKLKEIREGLQNWFDGLKETDNIPKYIIQGLVNGLKNGAKTVFDTMIQFGKGILEAICKILGIHSPSTEFFEIGKNIIQGLINGLQNGISMVFNFFKNLGMACVELFNKIDFGKLLAAAIGIGMLVTIVKLLNVINGFAAPLEGLGDMFEDIGRGVKSFGQGVKKWGQAQLIESIAKSIAILAASIVVLSLIEPKALLRSVLAIAALAAVIGVLAWASSKAKNVGDLGRLSLTFVGISAALWLMASVFKKLASIDSGQMNSVIKGFGAIIVGFVALIAAFGKLVKGDSAAHISKVGGMLAKISIALLIMVGVIKLASMLDGEELLKGLAVIGVLGTFFIALIAVSKLAGEHAKQAGKMISKIAFSMLMMLLVIKLASKLEGEELLKGLAVMGVLTGFVMALIVVSNLAGQHAAKAGAMMLMISIALAITVAVIKQISGLSDEEIKHGMLALSALGVFFTALIAVSKLAGQNALKAGAMLLMISAALVILAGVLFILSKMDMKGLYQSLGIITVLEILFGGLIFVSQYVKDSAESLLIITIAIGLLIAALIGLTFINPKKLLTAASSISMVIASLALVLASTKLLKGSKSAIKTLGSIIGVIGILAILVALMSKIKKPQAALASAKAVSVLLISLSGALAALAIVGKFGGTSINKSVGSLYLLSGVVAVLAAILGVMDHLNVTASLESVKALSALLLAMSGVLVVLSLIGMMKTNSYIGVGALALLTIVVAGLAAILVVMNDLDISKSMNTVKSLSILLMNMSAALVILSVVGMMGPAAFIGLAALGTLIVGLGAVVTALGALVDKFPQLETFLNKGIPILEKIGYALGAFVGNIVSGVMVGATSSLPTVGKNLSDFMDEVSGFIDGAKNIDKTIVDNIASLAKAILMITGADLVQSIASWITGDSSLAEFGAQLSDLGTAMSDFVTNLGTFTKAQVEAVDCAGQAITSLANAASKIPGQDGLWQKIAGEKSLAAFGAKLPLLGSHLKMFVFNLGTFNEAQVSAVDCAGKAIVALAEAADKIPNEGGWAAKILGDNSISTFGAKLPDVANNLKGFVTNLGTFNDDQVATVDCAGKALKALADSASMLPNEGGLGSLFTGDNDISKFGAKLPGVATNLKDFMNSIGTFGQEQIQSVNAAVNALKAIAKLGEIDISKFCQGIGAFGSKLNNFAVQLAAFVGRIGMIDQEHIESAMEKIKELVNMITKVASSNQEAISNFGNALNKIGLEGLQSFLNAFTGLSINTIKMTAASLLANFVLGAKASKATLTNEMNAIGLSAVKSLASKTNIDAAKAAGQDLATGFANGITSKTSMATVAGAGTAIGKAALAAAKAAIKSNSPSKEAMKIGNYFGQGLVIGIQEYEANSYDAGYGIADRAKDGLSRAISKVSDIIASDIDAQPTIRPVLDLSEVESGAGYLSSMFNDPSLGVMSNINAISQGMNTRNQNGTNNDVVTAINKLRKDLGNVSGTTNNYNVNGITYDDGSNITDAVRTLVRAATIERRV